ncbi:hypothetical protein NA57DRAFT_71883 [Rhizodiscina lignyota]|uniref:Uncharacterized protein n=1 Tax=Rhizodiscina lignyota TaxID=1504668 RepID=A0A9P4IKN1_9PEZI|nr:hypothetical protein NA57DRAFT_71883 [Rhizodiscina lignyota]
MDQANFKRLTAPISVFRDDSDSEASHDEPRARRFFIQSAKEPLAVTETSANVQKPPTITPEKEGQHPNVTGDVPPLTKPQSHAPLITYSRKNATARDGPRPNNDSRNTEVQPAANNSVQTPTTHKRRRLPDVGGLVLVPTLDDLQADESPVSSDSHDEIEDEEAETRRPKKRTGSATGKLLRAPLSILQKNVRFPARPPRARVDVSPDLREFRMPRKELADGFPPDGGKHALRDGFVGRERQIAPTVKRKRRHVKPVDLRSPWKALPLRKGAAPYSPCTNANPRTTLPLVSSSSHSASSAAPRDGQEKDEIHVSNEHEKQVTQPPRRSKSIPLAILTQLERVTAPARSPSPSDSEDDIVDEDETENISQNQRDGNEFADDDIDMLDEGHQSESRQTPLPPTQSFRRPSSLVLNDVQVPVSSIMDRNLPEQAARMLKGGKWNEVEDDLIEESSPRNFEVASKVRNVRGSRRTSVDEHRSGKSHPRPVEVSLETQSYFTMASQRLYSGIDGYERTLASAHLRSSPRHILSSKRMEDDDDELLLRSDFASASAADFDYNEHIQSAHPPRRRSPVHDLKTLVRRTSVEFGTLPSGMHRSTSIPFQPPFRNLRC